MFCLNTPVDKGYMFSDADCEVQIVIVKIIILNIIGFILSLVDFI